MRQNPYYFSVYNFPIAKKEKRAGSFPPIRRRKRKHLKVPGPLQVLEPRKVSASLPVLKKAQSTEVEEKSIEEKGMTVSSFELVGFYYVKKENDVFFFLDRCSIVYWKTAL